MSLSSSDLLQIAFAGLMAAILFAGAYALPQRITASILILLIPFQAIETRYASSNTLMTCMVFIAFLLKERDIRLPLLPQALTVLIAFSIPMALSNPDSYTIHGLYMLNLGVAFLVFWIAYDLTMRSKSIGHAMDVFVGVNILIAIYCVAQLLLGPGNGWAPFGIDELRMMDIRDDYRLTGPFGGPGLIAEYFVLMIYVVAYLLITASGRFPRYFLIGLLGVDFLLLITTGNRGGLLTLVGSGVIFLWLYRDILGPVRTVRIALTAAGLLAVAGTFAVVYTDYGVVFDRLVNTELDEGIPDTRQRAWPNAWAEIVKQPIFGHGPRLRFPDEDEGVVYEGHVSIQYPHSLYLFLLFTVGATGLVAFLIFLGTPLYRCWRLSRESIPDVRQAAFVKTGIILMTVIFVDQIKVEFLRYTLIDYWHFLFALLGMIVGGCDRIKAASRQTTDAALRDTSR